MLSSKQFEFQQVRQTMETQSQSSTIAPGSGKYSKRKNLRVLFISHSNNLFFSPRNKRMNVTFIEYP